MLQQCYVFHSVPCWTKSLLHSNGSKREDSGSKIIPGKETFCLKFRYLDIYLLLDVLHNGTNVYQLSNRVCS